MSHNPTSIVKPKQQKQRQQENKQSQTTTNEINPEAGAYFSSEKEASTTLSLEEQLDCFADLLIDLYLLDQQLSDHED